jgi:hypothetical protein
MPDEPGTLLCIAVVILFGLAFYIAADRRP